MIRTLILAGFASLAILALGGPASAEAKPLFRVEEAPAQIEGEQLPKEKLVLATTNGTVECETAVFVNTAFTTTSSSTMEVFPYFKGCNVFGQLNIEPKMNGCSFLFHLVPGSEEFEATVDIVCPGTNEMVFPGAKCTVTIPKQNNLGYVIFHETPATEPGNIDGQFVVLEIKYKEATGCKAKGETTNASWVGRVEFNAVNEIFKPQRLWIG